MIQIETEAGQFNVSLDSGGTEDYMVESDTNFEEAADKAGISMSTMKRRRRSSASCRKE